MYKKHCPVPINRHQFKKYGLILSIVLCGLYINVPSTALSQPLPKNTPKEEVGTTAQTASVHTQNIFNTKNQRLTGADYVQKRTEIETYLNTLTTFSAQFEQAVNGVHPSSGLFFLKKPGKFLWQYQKPDPSKLISNGGEIYFHDETTNQTTQVPRQGMADLLTRKTFNLEKEKTFQVEAIYEQNGLLHLALTFNNLEEGDLGQKLTLTFLQNPIQLRQITTFNQLGQRVEMLFYNIRENIDIAAKTFAFTPFHYREK